MVFEWFLQVPYAVDCGVVISGTFVFDFRLFTDVYGSSDGFCCWSLGLRFVGLIEH